MSTAIIAKLMVQGLKITISFSVAFCALHLHISTRKTVQEEWKKQLKMNEVEREKPRKCPRSFKPSQNRPLTIKIDKKRRLMNNKTRRKR